MDRDRHPPRETARELTRHNRIQHAAGDTLSPITDLERRVAETRLVFIQGQAGEAMTKMHSISDRALELAHSVSANLKDAMPGAGSWIRTGAALGAARAGARVAGGFVRRHPVALVGAVAGAGLIWYLVRKRAQRNGADAIEGRSRRVDAYRVDEQDRSAGVASSGTRGKGRTKGQAGQSRGNGGDGAERGEGVSAH